MKAEFDDALFFLAQFHPFDEADQQFSTGQYRVQKPFHQALGFFFGVHRLFCLMIAIRGMGPMSPSIKRYALLKQLRQIVGVVLQPLLISKRKASLKCNSVLIDEMSDVRYNKNND